MSASGPALVDTEAEHADDLGPSVEHEFKRQQVETTSSPQTDLIVLAEELADSRREVAERAATQGAVPAALATDPAPASPVTTEDERYERMSREFGAVAHGQLICGMHVHVAVDDRDEGVAVLDRIRGWLPVLLALSANSPYHQGLDTGYASYRTVRQQMWPTAGPTEIFGSLEAYDAEVAALVATGAAMDDGMIYFDARLSARYPTVEIRVMDVVPTPEIAVVLAGLCRAVVETAVMERADGVAPLALSRGVVRAATWRAARWGLTGELVRPGRGGLVSAADVVDELLSWVRSSLVANGDLELVEDGLRSLCGSGPESGTGVGTGMGTGAERQRSAFLRRGRIEDVVAEAVDWTLG